MGLPSTHVLGQKRQRFTPTRCAHIKDSLMGFILTSFVILTIDVVDLRFLAFETKVSNTNELGFAPVQICLTIYSMWHQRLVVSDVLLNVISWHVRFDSIDWILSGHLGRFFSESFQILFSRTLCSVLCSGSVNLNNEIQCISLFLLKMRIVAIYSTTRWAC